MKIKLITSLLLVSSFSAYATSVAVYDEGFKVADLPVESKVYSTAATKLVVPNGLVVVAYTAPNLQGTNKSYSVGTYEGLTIRSLRVSDQENDPVGTNAIRITFNPPKPSQWLDRSVCALAYFFHPVTLERVQQKVCAAQTVSLEVTPTEFKNGTEIEFGVRAENRGQYMTVGSARVEVQEGLFNFVPGSSSVTSGSTFTPNGDGSFTFANYRIINAFPVE